jgi:membrane-bound lytic murein transglycosylase A
VLTTPAAPLPYSPDPLGDDLKTLLDAPPTPVVDVGADRATIEAAPLSQPALAWMRPEDLFFMQIQGSGVLDLPDGRRLRAAFAASNGKPFVGIARVMREEGLLADRDTSQASINAWLVAHRGPEADALMRRNPRYIFFKTTPDAGDQPAGAAGVPLPAGRSLAVDSSRHAMGELYWIDASAPALAGAFPVYRRLATALDVGGAIKGEVRADLYIGRGEAAGREAGRVRHTLRMYRLVPRS